MKYFSSCISSQSERCKYRIQPIKTGIKKRQSVKNAGNGDNISRVLRLNLAFDWLTKQRVSFDWFIRPFAILFQTIANF